MKEPLKFPDGFLWGASTSAHQIEGGEHNDWTEWEKHNAHRLAAAAAKAGPRLSPIWDEIKMEAVDPHNYVSGQATDHWNQYEDDFEIVQSLGLSAYRFSVDWARLEPEEGQTDLAAVEHYRAMIRSLKSRGIEPFLTIWHWPLPVWLSKKGGWNYKEITHHYVAFASLLVREFGDDVKFWVTLNEPNVSTENGYFRGVWPPNKHGLGSFAMAVSIMIKAHREVYHVIKAIDPAAKVGISNNFIPYVAYKKRFINRLLQQYANFRWNYNVLYQIREHLDFIGVNHYFGWRINYGFNKPVTKERSDLNWELDPSSIYPVLRDLKKFKLPIYITEHGLADRGDRLRGWFIRETLKQVHRAIEHGADVRGYFHWSLLDNFEWDKGFWPRFGLVEVDYKTFERKLRPSALEYAEIIRQNGLSESKQR